MEFRTDWTWVGLGAKGGGHLFGIGAETFEGAAARLDCWTSSITEFNISSIRFGPGLGGSIGVSVLLVFNTPVLSSITGMQIRPSWGDFNVNLALPEFKVNGKAMVMLAKVGRGLRVPALLKSGKAVVGGLKPKDITELRDFAHLYWNAVVEGNEAYGSSATKLIVFDIPGAGVGLEASLFWTAGELNVG